MQDPDFEKQVREKMDGLQFSPSSSVWAFVEQEIQRNKRRRMPLVWVFLLTGLLLGACLIWLGKLRPQSTSQIAIVHSDASGAAHLKANPQPGQAIVHLDRNKTLPKMKTVQPIPANVVTTNKLLFLSGGIDHQSGIRDLANSPLTQRSFPDKLPWKTEPGIDPSQAPGPIEKPNSPELAGKAGQRRDSKPVAKTNKTDGVDQIAVNQQPANPAHNNNQKSAAWRFGLVAEAGFSNVNPASGYSGATVIGFLMTAPYSRTAGIVGSPANQDLRPKSQAGLSMALGLAAEWRIAKRFSIITGFQYHYYSDRAEVGIKMQNTGLPTLPSAYYMPGTGTTYHNQLHFLEIPLMIQVKLLAAKQYGLYWEGGIGYAALIGTNQLFYDKNMGCYYPSPNQIRQTQTFGRTAIVVGYKERTRYMELGPTLDYGFTPLQKAGTNSPTHLYMVGLQYRIFFN